MLSDRERRTLADIERALVSSDPDFARLFSGQNGGLGGPAVMLAFGLGVMVLGAAVVSVAVAVVGMVLALGALFAGYQRPHRFRSGRLA